MAGVIIDPSSITRLAIRAPNWLGDAVMALPAMAAVREAFRGATVTVAALPSIAPLFEEETIAAQDEILVVPDVRREADVLRGARLDAALLLPNSFRTAWSARRAAVPGRWGYATGFRGRLLTHSVRRPRGRAHQSIYYLDLVRGLGLPADDRLPRVIPAPATMARAAALLESSGVPRTAPVVGFAPGAAYGHAKRWPPRRVADLIRRLAADRGVACVLVGASGDRDAGREIESSLPGGAGAVNLIGRTDLRVLTGVLARCAAFVSNDSGGMHLAAAAGVPVVATFGPTDDRVTAPLGDHDVLIHQVFCRPCMLRDCPIDHRCMKGITVDAVYAAVTRRLDAGRRG